MRRRKQESGLTVNAVAGTHVVVLGLNLSNSRRKGCLGFALQREDHTEDERYWMRGMKTFKATEGIVGPGDQFSSREHPFQTFQWSDYSAKPDHDYTYRVVPLYGTPKTLKEGDDVRVRVRTEDESGTGHSVFFNRGAVSSQEYARRFQNKDPDQVGEAAYRWLSRGLLEALIAFIQRAKGPAYGLYGAVYEFQWNAVLDAIRKAAANGAKVRVVYDAIDKDSGPRSKNQAAINNANIKSRCIERTEGTLMHNKFFVLTKNDKPVAVWTGSTNLTENGIFGHSNCGHVVEDASVARSYLEYWNRLEGDPQTKDIKTWIGAHNPAPPKPWTDDEMEIFSPRKGLNVLDWYARIADRAKKALFMTFAFGMHKSFQQVYEQNDGVLRFALMEKEGNGAQLEQGRKDIKRIRGLPNVVVAVANNLEMNSFDRWLKERKKLTPTAHVKWIHTKYMLVDPLGTDPVVVSGSANFSEASTERNDENMIVVRGKPGVADIYLGEFMRLHAHYAFREAVEEDRKKRKKFKRQHLKETDAWQRDYFTKGNQRYLRRRYFSGG